MSRFVAVVGTVNRDVIIDASGERRTSLGGILYNVIPLAALLEGSGLRVRPVGRLGRTDRDEAMGLLSAFPSVDADTLIADAAGTDLSILDYSGGGERAETVVMRVAPLSEEDLAAARGAEAVLVNMISGRDVPLETLTSFRRGERGRFLFDVQALARTAETPRASRIVPDAPGWSRLFHVVRGSETEIGYFGGTPGNVEAAAERILAAGAGEVLATYGERGAVRYVRGEGGLRRSETPAVRCDAPADPTGCGDSFLSGVCAGGLLGLSPEDAVRLGALVASRVVGLAGLESLVALRSIRHEALAHEPAWAAFFGD
ncbi:MAG: carbohydrate kinase family protein [bacterium]